MLQKDSEKAEDTAEKTGFAADRTSTEYQPTEEDLAYKGWKHLIPFRSGSKYVPYTYCIRIPTVYVPYTVHILNVNIPLFLYEAYI